MALRVRPQWVLCAVAILGASGVAAQGPSTESRVTACAGIPEGGERLACYDTLASDIFGRAKPLPSPPAAAQPVAPAVSTAPSGAAQTPTAQTPVTQAAPAQPVAASSNAVPDRVQPAPAQTPSAQTGQAMFGLNGRSAPTADAALRSITARVIRLRALGPGGFTMELDNGQTWEQVESTELHLQEGDTVKIARAALGSFWLTTSSHRGSRVKRVR